LPSAGDDSDSDFPEYIGHHAHGKDLPSVHGEMLDAVAGPSQALPKRSYGPQLATIKNPEPDVIDIQGKFKTCHIL
jgi:hypothetical protein